jgi:hypothetical protein
MKQKDMALILVIIVISAAVSLLISNKLFGPQSHQQEVEVVQAIKSDFPTPDKKYFNEKSIDPTQLIQIGTNNNQNPFNGSAQ